MGNRVGKGFQLPIGHLQLRGTLHDSLFQFFIEFADLTLVGFSLRDVAESNYAAAQRPFLIYQATTATFHPRPSAPLVSANKHLSCTRFSPNGADQSTF